MALKSRLAPDVTLSGGMAAEISSALDLAINVARLFDARSAVNLLRETANKFDDIVREADERHERGGSGLRSDGSGLRVEDLERVIVRLK